MDTLELSTGAVDVGVAGRHELSVSATQPGARTVPLDDLVSVGWTGENVAIGWRGLVDSPGAVAVFRPDTGDVLGIRPGAGSVSVSVNGVQRTLSVDVRR